MSVFTFQAANSALRSGSYEDAVKLYDNFSRQQPRNYQARLNAVWACIKSGHLLEAERRLELLDQSPNLSSSLLHGLGLIIEAKKREHFASPWLETPADYLRQEPQSKHFPGLRLLKVDKKFPKGYPFDLELPSIIGNANNYQFIVDAVNRHRSSYGRGYSKCLVVAFAASEKDVHYIFDLLRLQTIEQKRVELLIFKKKEVTSQSAEMSFPTKWIEYDFSINVSQINNALSDYEGHFILFLQQPVSLNPWLIEHLGHYNEVTSKAVHVFVSPASVKNFASSGAIGSFDASSEVNLLNERYGFRNIRSGNISVSVKLFRQISGLNESISSIEVAFQELGYRLFLNGAYFLPASSLLSSDQENSRAFDEGRNTNNGLIFKNYCAANWWRKEDGIFQSPKVSIYVPSYNNSPYIIQAIQSALEQDFKDLEICVWDDGSTDDSLQKLLVAFSGDSRVRVMEGSNGGIGFASNRAVEMTRGMYVGQLDSDDLLKPGAIRKLVDYLDNFPDVGCVYSSCERIDADGKYIGPEYSFPVFSREKMMVNSIAHHFRMFRRQCWARTAGFREDILNAVDYDMFLKLSEVTKFHHIEEILYQRRWHGNNTSFVNESAQSSNTTVVLNKSLWRQGLSAHWHASAPNPTQPRQIVYRRLKKATRVFFWPDYSRANPYQKLLYGNLDSNFEIFAGEIDSALKLIADDPSGGNVVFHLHWTSIFFGGTETESAEAIASFEKKLAKFRKLGGKFVWTIHNAASHDGKFLNMEQEFLGRLAANADRVHMHSVHSMDELNFHVSAQKVSLIPHGSYIGYYPNYISRYDARDQLGLAKDAFVLLFTGQVRPYKGLERLLAAFSSVVQNSNWCLVIAGKSTYDFDSYLEKFLTEEVRAKILFLDRFIDDHALQLFYLSADVAVFPYEKILTSGSALLAMSFGVPPILPAVGMAEELLQEGLCGFSFETQNTSQLSKVLSNAFNAKNSGKLSQMSECSLERARSLNWEGVDKLLTF